MTGRGHRVTLGSRPALPQFAGRTWPLFLAVLVGLAVLASAELYVVFEHRRAAPAPTAVAPAEFPIGSLDAPTAEALVAPKISLAGWALARDGIARIEARFDGRAIEARRGLARADVSAAKPGYPESATPAFALDFDASAYPAAPNVDRRALEIVAIDRNGRESVLGRRDVIEARAFTRWRSLDLAREAPVFHLLPALSGVGLGSATGIDSAYAPYLSTTMRGGMRVPILYLRTTKGAAADYAFDPAWDVERRCGDRRIAEDSLATTLEFARTHRVSLLLTLNGGIWADASCDVPDWDLNDHLEQDRANCQWNEKNEVMADDALRHLPGSQEAPELGRSLTFNVYARAVRSYKRRNLQAAARAIAQFAREQPDLFVGVSLDPDTYLNPFFGETQWYDYNPGTLRQFREWLAGTGPYAGRPEAGVPDLSRYRRTQPLTLAQASKLAGRRFARWHDVDPPRVFPREAAAGQVAFWDDPWTHEWEVFRRHLVDLHYDELSQWAAEAGIAPERIWSAQGFMAPHANARPFAVHVASPSKNYDTGGMSVEGAVPSRGHLGAILYGASAVNDIRMETSTTLFGTMRALDPGWAVVEINTADLRNPAAPPDYASGYRSLRDLFNYGARFVSPMAWNGSNGTQVGKPGYVTFTAWRSTPFEDAARDFLLAHANVPQGARLWTFGTPRHADDDGWSALDGTIARAPGALIVTPDARGIASFVSPRELDFDPARFAAAVIGMEDAARLRAIRLAVRASPDAAWQELPVARAGRTSEAGLVFEWPASAAAKPYDQLRITLELAPGSATRVLRIALWPRASGRPS